MINKIKNKRVQLTLPRETAELLKSLSIRYNKSISEVVKWALNILASKKQHIFTIRYNEVDEEPEKQKEVKSKSWDELLDDIDNANQKH